MTTKVENLDRSDAELREDLLRRLVERQLLSPLHQIQEHQDPSRLPMRELPHGTVSALYLMYLAYARTMSIPPACKSVFYSVAREWNACLRFHRKTTHSMCIVCSSLRSQIRESKDARFFSLLFLWPRSSRHTLRFATNCCTTTASNGATGLCTGRRAIDRACMGIFFA